jgi:hypothetical protein
MTSPISSTPDRQKICTEYPSAKNFRGAIFSAAELLSISSRITRSYVSQFTRTNVLETTRLNYGKQWRESGSKALGVCVFREWVFRQRSNRLMITDLWKRNTMARDERRIILARREKQQQPDQRLPDHCRNRKESKSADTTFRSFLCLLPRGPATPALRAKGRPQPR